MSFKVFQSIVSKTLEDVDALNSLYLKLKDRLTDLIEDPTADQNGYHALMIDNVLNAQWVNCCLFRG